MEELCAMKKVRFIRMTQQKEDLPAEQRAPAIPKRRASSCGAKSFAHKAAVCPEQLLAFANLLA